MGPKGKADWPAAGDPRFTALEQMIDISPHAVDWVSFRQALSLSLATGKPFAYRGAMRFINENPPYSAFLSDFDMFFQEQGLGHFMAEGDDISFTPKGPLSFGSYRVTVNPYSSAVEMLLLLALPLFNCPFRTKLLFSGVSHSPLSPGTSWMKESFLAVLEQMGLYAGVSLRRFGFYGSGGGVMEARVYPSEAKAVKLAARGELTCTGVRVYIAHLDTAIAVKQKEALRETLGLDQARAGILEVQDCDGAWNHAEAYLAMAGFPIVLWESAPVYNLDGKNIFTEETAFRAAESLALRAREFIASGKLPSDLVREAAPFAIMTGSEIGLDSYPDVVLEAGDIARMFLG